MRPFRNALFDMLSGALVAQFHLNDFEIEDEAASIFVNRAIDNIEKPNAARDAQYRAALQAIQKLPEFLSKIRHQMFVKKDYMVGSRTARPRQVGGLALAAAHVAYGSTPRRLSADC